MAPQTPGAERRSARNRSLADTGAPSCDGGVTRRGLLLGLGAGMALGPARVAFGQASGDARFCVVLLRGALDGLSAVPAYGDPNFAALRGALAQGEPGREGGALDLGGRFGLHPRLAKLHEMYRGGEALVLHAVAGPWRTRSHFDAQDFLEIGSSGSGQRMDSGWLNRALAAMPQARGAGARTGLAVGTDIPLLMRGSTPVANYAPQLPRTPEADLYARIAALSANDPLIGPAIAQGLRERGYATATLGEGATRMQGGGGPRGGAFAQLATAAGRLLAAPDGPRVAAFEIGGWDTHAGQVARLVGPLGQLDDGLGALKEALGTAWRHTAVLVVTEFGRTVRVNGTGGTDHGTGGVAFVIGGAVAGGVIRGTWPGLSDGALFQGRDLAPTMDLRAVAKGLLRDHLRLPPQAVAQAFPGSDPVTGFAGMVRSG